MQNANTILSILNRKSAQNKQFVFDRLYRNMFNQDFFMEAYRKMYANPGNMTPGADGQTIDGFKKSKIDELIEKLKNEQYYPNPTRRVYIPKKNGKMRPLGIASFEDKLVQEVVRKMLEAIYEPIFLETCLSGSEGAVPETYYRNAARRRASTLPLRMLMRLS